MSTENTETEQAVEQAPVVTLTHPDTHRTIEADPGHVQRYTSQGWRVATPKAPAGNASLDAWQAFARSQGFTDEQLEGQSRDQLRAALS